MKGIIWALAALVALFTATAAPAQAQQQQECPPVGWALGYSEVVDGDTLWTVAADGPLQVWLDKGWTNSGVTVRIDDRLFEETQMLYLVFKSPTGEQEIVKLFPSRTGPCLWSSEPAEDGFQIHFGVLADWRQHYHPEIVKFEYPTTPPRDDVTTSISDGE